MKKISILGSTGSIGVSALKVAGKYSDRIRVEGLTCGNNVQLFARQVETFRPLVAAILPDKIQPELVAAAKRAGTELLTGEKGIETVASLDSVDTVVAGILGAAGLKPVISAVKGGKRIALANKEAMVLAGELIQRMVREYDAEIVPVDSEHSAIFQSLLGQNKQSLEKLILCASGGPFRGRTSTEIAGVAVDEALNHPRWKMGRKITIDSATLMNKALEIIEAKWLFDVEPDQIDVVVHPQCIVHSMVEYVDGSIIAQMGKTDMVMPIQFALSYPERWANDEMKMSLPTIGNLEFFEPDRKTFPSIDYAYEALETGGTMPVVLNAADEIAVASYLQGDISFGQIYKVLEHSMIKSTIVREPSLDDIFDADAEGRERAREIVRRLI